MRLPLSAKIVGLIGVLLVATVISVVWSSTRLFVQDNTALIEQTNLDLATSLTLRVRDALQGVTDKMRVLATVLLQPTTDLAGFTKQFYGDDKDFLALLLFERSSDGAAKVRGFSLSPLLARLGDGAAENTKKLLLSQSDFSVERTTHGEGTVFGMKLTDGTPTLAIALPFGEHATEAGLYNYALVGILAQNHFKEMFSSRDLQTAFLFDNKGRLLAHPDASWHAFGESLSHLDIVKEALSGKFNNGQILYDDAESNEAKMGAFRLVGFGGLGVAVEVPQEKAFEAAHRAQYHAVLIGLIVLCFAFFVGYFFSDSITWPVKQLVAAAHAIRRGDFDLRLKPKTRDELADLSLAFNEMAGGLAERDRVKAVFNKFHNKEIVEKLLSGEVKLGGEHRDAVIFFSDIRGFTAMSESLSPEEAVVMLNEYITRMVSIIRKYGGVVDKYVGDAIMALWGVPIGHALDSRHAIMACLEMREELARLNELRKSRGQNVIFMGMGLNRGEVIAGNIGSEEKMEYTVIGDAVNTASRIESMTKAYGTDLLIAQSLFETENAHFIFNALGNAELKGKRGVISLFEVLGTKDDTGKIRLINTPYSQYEPEDVTTGKIVLPKAA